MPEPGSAELAVVPWSSTIAVREGHVPTSWLARVSAMRTAMARPVIFFELGSLSSLAAYSKRPQIRSSRFDVHKKHLIDHLKISSLSSEAYRAPSLRLH